MYKIFFKYKAVIISGLILISLITAMILHNGALKGFFYRHGNWCSIGYFWSKHSRSKIKSKNEL